MARGRRTFIPYDWYEVERQPRATDCAGKDALAEQDLERAGKVTSEPRDQFLQEKYEIKLKRGPFAETWRLVEILVS